MEDSTSSQEVFALPLIGGNFRLSKDLRYLFREFHEKEILMETLVFLALVVSTYGANSALGLLYYPYPPGGRSVVAFISFIGGVPMALVGWYLVYLKYKAKQKATTKRPTYIHFFQNLFLLMLSSFLGMRVYGKVYYGQCHTNRLAEQLYCNVHAETDGYPQDSLLAMILVPLLYCTILRDTDWSATVLAWGITIFFLLLSTLKEATREKQTFFAFYTTLSALMLYSNQKQNIRSFLAQQQLAKLVKQNEEMAEELRANELRHMIGNVAHDLKTPLASFVTGLDMIADIAQDGLQKVAESQGTSPDPNVSAISVLVGSTGEPSLRKLSLDMKECLEGVLRTAKDNRNMNNFMMMTINRCIDYTKASKGVKLVPKYETIDLLETLILPFKCLHDPARRAQVHLDTLSAAICSHVITDKQWLQENILCLLSNAVKYSDGGTVNARMVLLTMEEIFQRKLIDLTKEKEKEQEKDKEKDKDKDSNKDSNSDQGSDGKPIPLARSSWWSCFRKGSRIGIVDADSGAAIGSPSGVGGGSPAPSSISSPHVIKLRKAGYDVVNPESPNGPSPVQLFDASSHSPASTSRVKDPSKQQVLLVEVEDTGIGMTQEIMDKLFTAFQQAQRLAGGTGLGLFSLARRVDALGGKYGVTYRRDGQPGSLFWFYIPYRPDEQYAGLMRDQSELLHEMSIGDLHPELSSRAFGQGSPTRRKSVNATTMTLLSNSPQLNPTGLRILIVDDSPAIQKMMSMMLRRHGHVVDQADNGAHAVALISKTYESFLQDEKKDRLDTVDAMRVELQGLSVAYDVVLMDLQMPVMDGLEAMRRIRSSEQMLRVLYQNAGLATRIDLSGSDDASFNREFSPSRSPTVGVLGSHSNSTSGTTVPAFERIDSTFGIRKKERAPSIDIAGRPPIHQFIIGVSANSDSETMQESIRAGADAFVAKPFSIDSFYDTINQCVHKQKTVR